MQGDHGEFYNRAEDMPTEEEMEARLNPPPLATRQRLLVAGCLLAAAAAVVVFAAGLLSIWRWARG